MENVQTEMNNHIAADASAVSCLRQSFFISTVFDYLGINPLVKSTL